MNQATTQMLRIAQKIKIIGNYINHYYDSLLPGRRELIPHRIYGFVGRPGVLNEIKDLAR